jgi:AraC-like DNA-binding protein
MIRFLRHGYGMFDAAQPIGPAKWPHHDLFFVHRGEVALEFPELDRRLTLRRGQGVLIWPQTTFHGRAVSSAVRGSIQHFAATGSLLAPLEGCVRQKNGFSPQGAPACEDLEHDIDRAIGLGRQPRAARGAVRLALLALILTEGGFLETPPAARSGGRLELEGLRTWLQTHIAHNPGVADLAKTSGLSTSRFRAVFLDEHRRPVGEFLRDFRETEARRLLAETQQSLKEIAAALGYADAVVFHRAFKGRVGLTPGNFRRKNRVSG